MAIGTENSRGSDDIDFHSLGLVERFCIRSLAQRLRHGDDDSVISEVPRVGPDQTARIVRTGVEKKIRWATIIALIGLAGYGWWRLSEGIDLAAARRAVHQPVMPAIGPAPPVNSGGCIATFSVSGLVASGRHAE